MSKGVKGFATVYGIISLLVSCSSPESEHSAEVVGSHDPLTSWNENEQVKARILNFIAEVTDEGSESFIPAESRIAVFDNDGTLWAEQPLYFQLFFAIDRVNALAPDHPEWIENEPFASVLKGDPAAALKGGTHAILELVMSTHGEMTNEEFRSVVSTWIDTATNPVTGLRYIDMTYQPMKELIDLLHEEDFKVFIVSGGGVDFMRAWAPKAYGIPRERIIGSSIKLRYESDSLNPTIRKIPELDFIDDKEGKPVGIEKFIGSRPIIAVGNSDGDFEMLEWTTAQDGQALGVLLHHTDNEREFAYDHPSSIGHLEKGLNQADSRGWIVIDMAKDWSLVWKNK
jgi:phosphoglycolate phosphatase-like HAD superfamily hydrolase